MQDEYIVFCFKRSNYHHLSVILFIFCTSLKINMCVCYVCVRGRGFIQIQECFTPDINFNTQHHPMPLDPLVVTDNKKYFINLP